MPLVRELMPGAAIVAPRGDVSEHGALRFFRRLGEGRYDMDDLARRTAAMADFVAAHVAAGRPSEVIGLGYSNGANILASVIFARPALFGRAVLMHPLIPWTPEPAPVTTRVLITAGERDPICPPETTRALEAWFRAQGAPVETALASRRARDRPQRDRRGRAASCERPTRKEPRMAIDPADIVLEEGDSKGRYVYRVGERRGGDDLLQGRGAARHHRPHRGAGRVPRPGRRPGAGGARRRRRPGGGQEDPAALPVRGGAVPPAPRVGRRAAGEESPA